MTKEELLKEAKLLDTCELADDETEIHDLMVLACKEISKLEDQVKYWKKSFNKQVEASR